MGWYRGRNLNPIEPLSGFSRFLRLRKNKDLSLYAIKVYRSALGQVFGMKDMDLTLARELSMLFKSFEKSWPPREMKPPQWDVPLVLESLRRPPYKRASNRDLTLRRFFS